jgi:hypothetical protein
MASIKSLIESCRAVVTFANQSNNFCHELEKVQLVVFLVLLIHDLFLIMLVGCDTNEPLILVPCLVRYIYHP